MQNERKNRSLWPGLIFCRRENSAELELDVHKPHSRQWESQA